MKPTAADFAAIRTSLLVGVGLAAVGAAATFVALGYAAAAAQAHRLALAQQVELRTQQANSGSEAASIRAHLARYREIAARGIVGEESRLDWVERIEQIAAARRLGAIQYELSPRQPVSLPGAGTAGYETLASTMKLQMPVLHEEDLLGFLAELADGASAFPRVRACNVERIDAALRADCRIDWITLREKT